MAQVWIRWSAAALLLCGATSAMAAEPYVSATVEGVLAPGVYGRINIGNNPPPPVVNTAPVVIVNQSVAARRPPVYVYAPPGHIKHWRRHCARYHACNQPVYFVNVDDRGHYVRGEDRHDHDRRGDDRGGPDRGGHGGGRDDNRGPGHSGDRGQGHRDR